MDVEAQFALEGAIEAGDVPRAAALLATGIDPNGDLHGRDGTRFVDLAFRCGDEEMIRLLHEYGGDIAGRLGHESNYGNGDAAIVRLLLELGGDPNIPDEDGWAPLHWAAVRGYEEKARVLLSAGADPTTRTRHGLLPIELAERNNHLRTAILLRQAAAGSGE
jgi:ankyrin repeat protein